MTDFDSRSEIYARQDRLDELSRSSSAITNRNPQDTISMLLKVGCVDCEAISNIVDFCLRNKDRWPDGDDGFRQLSWSIDRSKEFLQRAEDTFNG
jgi:hypothetical protein